MKKVIIVLILSILISGSGFAEEKYTDLFEMDEIVITATRDEKLLKDAPGAITVITKEKIAKKNTTDLAKVLEDNTGVKILRYGALGSNSTIHVRGLYSQHTLVMVDDRIVNAPSSSTADLSFLSVDNIERIEIVRALLITISWQ